MRGGREERHLRTQQTDRPPGLRTDMRRMGETRPAPSGQAGISGSAGTGQALSRHQLPSRALPALGPLVTRPLPLREETGR